MDRVRVGFDNIHYTEIDLSNLCVVSLYSGIFESVVIIIFQNIFQSKIHQNTKIKNLLVYVRKQSQT